MKSEVGVLALLLLAGCGSGVSPAAPARVVAAPDGMCREHGVLEAVCTRCNPKLVAIFQAKGDWCVEHEFPESFCPLCHPERGGRPRTALATSDGPADGTLVRLDGPETARAAGIETVAARAPEGGDELVVLGTITYDAARRAEVNARAGGILRELAVELGARVEAGARLARIESAQVGADRSLLAAARVRLETAEKAFERQTRLAEGELVARRTVEETRSQLEGARAEVAALRAALEPVGDDPALGGLYDVCAPLAGVVVRRAGTLGQLVEAQAPLFEVVDPSWMWAELDVPEAELARIGAGLEVIISSETVPGREFRGRIDHVAPEIDVHTRTAKARVHLANADGLLRANQFVQARVLVPRVGARSVVPREAVQRAEGVELVFVELGPARYEARRVRTAGVVGDDVALASGVEPGERVVTCGSFLLKTETLKGAIGAGCCAVE